MGATVGMLEREAEQEQLAAMVDACVDGRGAALVIEGEAGIGKTTLSVAGEKLAAERGCRVLTAAGASLEVDFAFGVVRQLLELELRRPDADRRERLLAGAAALAEPVVGARASGGAPPDAMALQHGLYWLLANLADEQPLVLAIDDLQWCDAASLRFVAYLAHRLQGMRVALLATVRTGERIASETVLDALRAEPAVTWIRPVLLGSRSVGELITAVFRQAPDGEFVDACHRVSGGNPFLIHELARALAGESVAPTAESISRVGVVGPAAVTRSVMIRLARLPADAVALANAIALLEEAHVSDAASLAGIDEDDAAAAADALADAFILIPGDPARFRHPLVRHAIYAELPARRRAADHKRAARLLSERDAPLERLAAHLLLTDPAHDPWVSETLRRAADASLMRGSPEPAVDYLTRSVSEPPLAAERAATLRALGSARFLTGDAGGCELLRNALDDVVDPGQRAQIVLELASMLTVLERIPEAVVVLEAELERHPEGDPLNALLRTVLLQIALFDFTTVAIVNRELPRQLDTMAGETTEERLLLATAAYAHGRSATPADRVAELAERAWADGALLGDLTTDVLRAMYVVTSLLMAERFDVAEPAIEQLLEFARERGSLHALDGASCLKAIINNRRGRLDEAEASARDALGAGHALGAAAPADLGTLIEILAEHGRLDAAEAELERSAVTDQWVSQTTSYFSLIFLRGRGRLRIAKGEIEAGLADILELGRRCELSGERNPAQHPWRSDAALALLRLGDITEARRLAAEEVQLARRFGAPGALAGALRAHGLAQGGAPGLRTLEEAASVIKNSACALTEAKVLADLGAALRRANQRTAAREPLQRALELAEKCGAQPVVAQARAELRAAGSRPRSILRSGADSLTGAERRVCELAAAGRSNPEIAQALFVTRGTVESHLHSAYRKLDVTSRAALAGALTIP